MASPEKINTIVDCNDESVSFGWNKSINRDGGKSGIRTENNNALMKLPPKFLNALQSIQPELNSDRKIKMFICQAVGLEWSEEFQHFHHSPYQQKATVQANATIDLNAVIGEAFKSGYTEEQIKLKLKSVGLTDEQLKPFFKAQPTTTADLKSLFI